MKLIARFYDVTGGAVLVNGVDVRDYDLTAFRHRLGVVPQEAYLFDGTVAASIAYARPSASAAEIEAAARAVGAHEMIMALPDGYSHQVGERGRSLSAGQRQLIALARAELADPDILLLDEATAALDLRSDQSTRLSARRMIVRTSGTRSGILKHASKQPPPVATAAGATAPQEPPDSLYGRNLLPRKSTIKVPGPRDGLGKTGAAVAMGFQTP